MERCKRGPERAARTSSDSFDSSSAFDFGVQGRFIELKRTTKSRLHSTIRLRLLGSTRVALSRVTSLRDPLRVRWHGHATSACATASHGFLATRVNFRIRRASSARQWFQPPTERTHRRDHRCGVVHPVLVLDDLDAAQELSQAQAAAIRCEDLDDVSGGSLVWGISIECCTV